MGSELLAIKELLSVLQAGPGRLEAVRTAVTSERLHRRPSRDEWSANEILAHIRTCADVWGGCVRQILAEEHPTIRAVNPRTWITRTDYHELQFERSLRDFTHQRTDLLRLLDSLPADLWTRAATVKGAGATLERTVHFYADWLARHERTHMKQVENLPPYTPGASVNTID